MQNYYRLLGVAPTATVQEITESYLYQRARLKRLAAHDPAMKSRLVELEAGYGILVHPRRRLAYDVLLAEEPTPLALPNYYERLVGHAQWGRRVNLAMLIISLLVLLDWALPQRELPHEVIRSSTPIPITFFDTHLSYRVHTQHTRFRLPLESSYWVRRGQDIVVWETPLLKVVQRISAPNSPDGPAPFRPYGGTIYGTFFLLPFLLGGVSVVGLWPGRSPETIVNTAAVGSLLAILILVIILSV
jgi:hypothetical protein